MKTNKYLIFPIILLLSSCYIYKPYSEKEIVETVKKNNTSPAEQKSIRAERSNDVAAQKTKEQQGKSTISLEDEPQKEIASDQQQSKSGENSNMGFSRSDGTSDDKTKRNTNKGNVKAEDTKPTEGGIKSKLLPNKYYKITALDNQYKIQVDKWEGDTLVSHKIRQPKKVYRHHINDIQEESILERRFSKPFSDLLTVGAYASGAAIVLLLIL